MMRILPNLFAIGWALLVLGSLLLSYGMPTGLTPQERAWSRIEVFLTWQGTALVIALVAAGLSLARRDPRGSPPWWMGWGPLLGSGVIAIVIGLAVLTAKLL